MQQQCGSHRFSKRLKVLEDWVQSGLQPDLTLLFDVPIEVSRQRLAFNQNLDRFEQEQQEFFSRVRSAYLDRADAFRQRIRVIDGNRTMTAIEAELGGLIDVLANPGAAQQ